MIDIKETILKYQIILNEKKRLYLQTISTVQDEFVEQGKLLLIIWNFNLKFALSI